jgi:hypothetical protein
VSVRPQQGEDLDGVVVLEPGGWLVREEERGVGNRRANDREAPLQRCR